MHGAASLSRIERERYRRQISLSEVGEAGQHALKNARVGVIGLGGLGAPCVTYLAAAGIGRLTLIDHDEVDLSNLHRQVLFTHADIGRLKTEVTVERIAALNPDIEIASVETKVSRQNVAELLGNHDVIVDCTDNFRARFAINDFCAATRTPLVQASILQFEAQLSVYCGQDGPCYRCLYPQAPPADIAPSCAEAGVLGILPGILGCYQANEILKLVLRVGEPLIGKLALFNMLQNHHQIFPIAKNPDCPACSGDGKMLDIEDEPDLEDRIEQIDASVLRRLLKQNKDIQLVDVRTPAERHEHGCIDNDLAIELAELPDHIHDLDPTNSIVCYCASGQRSLRAAEILLNNGFANVLSLRRGYSGWNNMT